MMVSSTKEDKTIPLEEHKKLYNSIVDFWQVVTKALEDEWGLLKALTQIRKFMH